MAQQNASNFMKELIRFLDRNSDDSTFQLEQGKRKGKHYQGFFILTGSRQSKNRVLNLFADNFNNISGLTLMKVESDDIITAKEYAKKEETRITGPFQCDKKIHFNDKVSKMQLTSWQTESFSF